MEPDRSLADRLKDRGWRLTAQRRVVAEVLAGDHVHLTADEVYGRAQERLPEISLATVYNTLNELVSMGEVLEIATGDGPKRYDPNAAVSHHHLHCVSCGALRDVNPLGADRLLLPAVQQHGFELLDVDIVFRGRCPDCRDGDGDGDGDRDRDRDGDGGSTGTRPARAAAPATREPPASPAPPAA